MELEVKKDFRNELLKRREVKVIFDAEKNPGFDESLKKVAHKFKAEEGNIVMKNVKSKFGRNTFLVDAFIYDSAEAKDKVEPKAKVKKEAGK